MVIKALGFDPEDLPTLFDAPELVNEDPFGDGWMLELEPSDDAEFDTLLSPDEYESQTA